MVKKLLSLLKARKRRAVVQSAVDRWALTQRVLSFGEKDFILLGQLYEGVAGESKDDRGKEDYGMDRE